MKDLSHNFMVNCNKILFTLSRNVYTGPLKLMKKRYFILKVVIRNNLNKLKHFSQKKVNSYTLEGR